jgi:hypothetical protein
LKEARDRFVQEVDGPIVVQSSKNEFLSWDEIRRYSLRQSLALYDVASGSGNQLARVTSYAVDTHLLPAVT